MIALSALSIGLLAWLGAWRRSVSLFVITTAVLWIGVAVALSYGWNEKTLIPGRIPSWRYYLSSFLGLAPMVLIPSAFTIPAVLGRVSASRIPLLALIGAVIGLPITFMTVLASTCYIAHDCP